MSLPRKDIKLAVDTDIHAALKAICDMRGKGLGEYIEALVIRDVQAVVHEVSVLADDFRRAGIIRNPQESQGIDRNRQEPAGIAGNRQK